MESRAVELLSRLVSIPTVNPPGERYAELVDLAERFFKSLGMDTEVVEVPRAEVAARCPECADRPRLILVARSGEPRIHFNGHYDVVPPGPPEGWRVTGPFEPRYVNGRLYGRGAVDMKGGLTSIMLAAERAAREGLQGFEVSLVPDEETGGETGAGYLVRSGMVNFRRQPRYVVLEHKRSSS